jgi:hypothetical protein
MTELWQLLGASDIRFDEMPKLDYFYVAGWSSTPSGRYESTFDGGCALPAPPGKLACGASYTCVHSLISRAVSGPPAASAAGVFQPRLLRGLAELRRGRVRRRRSNGGCRVPAARCSGRAVGIFEAAHEDFVTNATAAVIRRSEYRGSCADSVPRPKVRNRLSESMELLVCACSRVKPGLRSKCQGEAASA